MNSDSDDGQTTEADFEVIEMLAATWLSRRDRGLTPEEAVEFARWRAADWRHEAAVVELGAMWSALDDLAESPATVKGEPVPVQPVQPRANHRGWVPWGLAAAAGLALVATFALRREHKPAPDGVVRYETEVGAQRTETLPDGSTLRLNTDSAAEVSFTVGERRVRLERGEARFTVTKNAARPFVVAVEGTESLAVGTAFSVRRRDHETELLVTEGRVKFGGAGGDAATVEVAAGQSATCDPRNARAPRVETLDATGLARRVAWEAGRLICRPGMPLAEVAEEFNRYHRQKLVPRDAETAAIPVGGEFELAKLDALVRALDESFEIGVVERDADHLAVQLRRAGRRAGGRDEQ